MHSLEYTGPTAAENLAWEEALLLHAEESGGPELLRLWELEQPAVVLGAGGCVAAEVCREHCQADGIPILRRASGGGTVLLGPGCLCFTLVLRYDRAPLLHDIRRSFAYVLERIIAALAPEVRLHLQGSDLTLDDRKVSGNAQQRKRRYFLHHGTLLYAVQVADYARYLLPPPRQPEYRRQRPHQQFVTNLPFTAAELRRRLLQTWDAHEPFDPRPLWPRVHELMTEKYAQDTWHLRR
jgi:lipoate-protein ligase A